MALRGMLYKFYLQWVYDKWFSSQFLMESNRLVFLLQQFLFLTRLGSRRILDNMGNILNIVGSHSICMDSPSILDIEDSRSTCCMGSNILMGTNMDRTMEQV